MADFNPLTIDLDHDLLCKTTGHGNSCGLACLAHYLHYELSQGVLQKDFTRDTAYQSLLKSFQEYYELEKTPTWDEVYALLEQYPVDTDKEAILVPVLRKELGKILAASAEATLNTDAAATLSEYFETGTALDVAGPFFEANKAFLKEQKELYDKELGEKIAEEITADEIAYAQAKLLEKEPPMLEPSDEQIHDQVLFQRELEVYTKYFKNAKNYLLTQGADNYGNFMGNIVNEKMVSAGQLTLLTQALSIGLEVYTPESIQQSLDNPETGRRMHGMQDKPDKAYDRTLKVHNEGVHWVYQAPDNNPSSVARHNQYYPVTFYEDEFEANDALSGTFKIYGGSEELELQEVQRQVKDAVKQGFNPPIQERPTEKQTVSYQKLETSAQKAMNTLLDALKETPHTPKQDEENKVVFEKYFKAFQDELEKGPKVTKTPEKINQLIDEIENQYAEQKPSHKKPKNR